MTPSQRGVLLDFGGTLDSPGMHWSTQFALAFAAAGFAVGREVLDRAFLAADRALEEMPAVEELGYEAHVEAQARLMLQALGMAPDAAPRVAMAFEQRARPHLQRSAELLGQYRLRFRFALVSNFTPNLPKVLEETGLASLLDSAVCSARVGLRKPDPAIFRVALAALGLQPAEAVMVGDSLPSDIAPAKQLGLTTVWVRGDRVFGAGDMRAADFVASGLEEALAICASR